jgi:hypothetical protein
MNSYRVEIIETNLIPKYKIFIRANIEDKDFRYKFHTISGEVKLFVGQNDIFYKSCLDNPLERCPSMKSRLALHMADDTIRILRGTWFVPPSSINKSISSAFIEVYVGDSLPSAQYMMVTVDTARELLEQNGLDYHIAAKPSPDFGHYFVDRRRGRYVDL